MKHLKAIILLTVILLAAITLNAQEKPHCKALTKAGVPCKAYPVKGSEFCRVHNPNAIRCGALTKAGKPCRMVVRKTGDKCRFHGGQ